MQIESVRRSIGLIVPRSSTLPVVSATVSSSVSSLIFALMPKCPACLVLLLAPLGIRVPGTRWFLAYAIAMVAAVPLAFFLTPACRRCGARPLLLAFAGLAIMILGRIVLDSGVVIGAGAAMVFGAALWTARNASAGQAKACTASHSC